MASTTAYARSTLAAKPWMEPSVWVKRRRFGRRCSSRCARNLLTEVVHREAQAFFEVDARLPAELAACTRVVQRDAIDVAFSTRTVVGRRLVIGQEGQLPEQVIHGHRNAAADVVDPARAALERRQVGGGCITDVEHVARLFAVAVDGHGVSRQHPARKNRHHPSFLGKEVLPRTVDVGVAEDGELEAESSLERAEVLLKRELAGAVWRQWSHR